MSTVNEQGVIISSKRIMAEVLNKAFREGKPLKVPLQGLTIVGDVEFSDRSYQHTIKFLNCVFEGRFLAEDAKLPRKINLKGSTFHGDVIFSRASVHQLNAQNCRFKGRFLAEEANFDHSLDLGASEFEKNVNFKACKINGSLNLQKATIKEDTEIPSENSFQLLTLEGNLSCRELKASSKLDFTNARVRGETSFENAQCENGLVLTESHLSGTAKFQGAEIWGALKMDKVHVLGSVCCNELHLCRKVEEAGEVLYFPGINITGMLSLNKALIEGSITLQSAQIPAGLLARDSDIQGAMKIQGASIGEVDLENTKIESGTLTSLEVRGDLILDKMNVNGDLNIENAKISGNLRCGFQGDSTAHIFGRLILLDSTVAHAQFAPAGKNEKKGTSKIPPLLLRGFAYQELDVPNDDYCAFLEKTIEYRKGNYVRLEKWLLARGRYKEGEKVYLGLRKREHREAIKSSALRKIGYFLIGPLAFLRWLAFCTFTICFLGIVVFGLSAWLFSDPNSVVAKQDIPGGKVGNNHHPDKWNGVKGLRTALHVHLPGAPTSILDRWEPSSEELGSFGGWGITYQDYAHAAWFITYILVLPALGYGVLIKWSRRRNVDAQG